MTVNITRNNCVHFITVTYNMVSNYKAELAPTSLPTRVPDRCSLIDYRTQQIMGGQEHCAQGALD